MYLSKSSYKLITRRQTQFFEVGKSLYRYSQKNLNKRMASQHMKRCPAPLVMKEMQIKTTKRSYYIRTRMSKIKTNSIKLGQKCGEIEVFIYCWWECKRVQPLWKTVWQCLRKLCVTLFTNQQFHS